MNPRQAARKMVADRIAAKLLKKIEENRTSKQFMVRIDFIVSSDDYFKIKETPESVRELARMMIEHQADFPQKYGISVKLI